MEQKIFIDRFTVPANAKQEFFERMKYNRDFIKTMPGFIEDNAYEAVEDNGNLTIVTVAVWENNDAVNKAKEAVQAEYNRTGFNMPEFLKRLNISIERGVYNKIPA